MKKILDYGEMLELLDSLNKDIIIKQNPIVRKILILILLMRVPNTTMNV